MMLVWLELSMKHPQHQDGFGAEEALLPNSTTSLYMWVQESTKYKLF